MSVINEQDLSGLTALVTGAGRQRGTGHAIALALARHGADVALHGRGSTVSELPQDERASGWRGLESVAEEIEALGRRTVIVTGDLRDSTQVDRVVADSITGLGKLDVLVNNAAAPRGEDRVPIVELSDDLWLNVLDVKLNGAFYASRAVARHLVERGEGGSIVNVSSIAGKRVEKNHAAYAIANMGLQKLAASLAKELGRHGIRANALCVGIVDTSRIDDMGRGPEFEELVRRMVPLQRVGTTEEVAELVAFLVSGKGSYITGQSIGIDGGVTSSP